VKTTVCINLVERKNAASKNIERKNIEGGINAASVDALHV
jgi:hypothetical protein